MWTAALCYAEFASMVPASGSAYTYAYTSFGEIVAWIIGWMAIGLVIYFAYSLHHSELQKKTMETPGKTG